MREATGDTNAQTSIKYSTLYMLRKHVCACPYTVFVSALFFIALTPLAHTPCPSLTLHPQQTMHDHHISDGSQFIVTISLHGTDKTRSISPLPRVDTTHVWTTMCIHHHITLSIYGRHEE